MQVGLLGPLTLRGNDGRELPSPAAAKERSVLLLLALRAPHAVTPSELIDAVWGDEPPRTASKTLQTYISALRRLLPPGTIDTVPGGYRLNVDQADIDVNAFERSLDEGVRALRDGDPGQAAARLRHAVGMWRGEPLVELDGRSVGTGEKSRLEELLRSAQEALVDARLALGEHATLIGDLEAAAAAEPLRERRWEQLMLALYRAGRQSDALRACQRLRRVLADELGLEPAQTTRDLEAAILAHDPALTLTGRSSTTSRPGSRTLPAGNVTFVFTDMEGSTLLARHLGNEYPRVLEDHRQIIRASMVGRDGTEIDARADGFFFVFSDAGAALSACVDAQRGLAEHPWPAGGRVRVRMGAHSGVAEPTEQGEYLSIDVHQAQRIMDAGHGGQILCSATTAGLVRHQLRQGLALVDRGPFMLAGFDEPERIFQLAHADLESEFPPLRASHATSHNLPNARTSFVGRAGDLGALADLLGRSRLVTVVGPGGVGKTRLAVEAGSRQASHFDSGVRLADLSPIDDDGVVVATIAAAFGVRAVAGADPLAAIYRTLAGGRGLLILDNCEHVLGTVRAAVKTLLDRSEGLSVLATSRQPLAISGEQIWAVSPLGLPDAVRLFEQRARLVQPQFSVTTANAESVAAICRAVDGLPLAVEVAAARVAVQPLTDLATRLAEGIGDLRDRSEDRDDRHATLEATIAWSYRRLDEAAAALLRLLSVFAGGFALDAVLAVSAENHRRETLISLVNQSLVIWDPDAGRYRLLETIRRFASDRLHEAGEAPQARHAQAAFYHRLAQRSETELTGPAQARCLERLHLDHDNLRRGLSYLLAEEGGGEEALEMLAALRRYWFLRADLVEWTTSNRELLERDDPRIPPSVRSRALVAATLSAAYVDATSAKRWGEMGLAVAQLAGDSASATEASSLLAAISYFLGSPDPGLGEKALALARELGDPVRSGEALFGAAMSYMRQPLEAGRLYEHAVSVTQQSGDRLYQYLALANLGLLHQELGKLVTAQGYLQLAVEVGEQLGYKDPLVISSLSRVLVDRGLTSEAYRHLDAALHFPQNSPYQSAGAIRGAAHLAMALGEWPTAARLYGFADTLLGRAGHGGWGDEPLYEHDRAALADQLQDSFEPEYRAGTMVTWEDAVSMARSLGSSEQALPGSGSGDPADPAL